MKCYIVSCEVALESTRSALIEKLKSNNGFCPINHTCWAIATEQTAAQVRDSLITVLGATDRLFVIRSGTEAAWRNSYGQAHNDWLKKNL